MTLDDEILNPEKDLDRPKREQFQYKVTTWCPTTQEVNDVIVVASDMLFFPNNVLGFLTKEGRLVRAFGPDRWIEIEGMGYVPETSMGMN